MIEFYQGWMIELAITGSQVLFTCYSPYGETLSDWIVYTNYAAARQAAFDLIDQLIACACLKGLMREAFEANLLSLAEWQNLTQSLDYIARIQFMKSPSSPE